MTYDKATDHLLDELRRLDLILLNHLRRISPRDDASRRSHERVVELLTPPRTDAPKNPWAPKKNDTSDLLHLHSETISRAVKESLARGLRLPLLELCRNLDFDSHALGILMLACAPSFNTHYEQVYSYLQGAKAATQPRVSLAIDIFAQTPVERFSLRKCFEASSPLLRTGHLRLCPASGDAEGAMLLQRRISATPRLIAHLLGDETPRPLVAAMQPRSPLVEASTSELEALRRFGRIWDQTAIWGPIALIDNDNPEGLLSGLQTLASERQRTVLAVDLGHQAALSSPIKDRVIEAFREAALRDALLFIVGLAQLPEADRVPAAHAIASALGDFKGACIILGDLLKYLNNAIKQRPVIELSAAPPDAGERASIWQQALKDIDGSHRIDGDALAWKYQLNAAEIRDATRLATTDAQSREGAFSVEFPPALTRSCRIRARRNLESLAQVIPARGQWSDLILPGRSQEQLAEFVGHLRHHDLVFGAWGLRSKVLTGDGTAALFAGPPGTGKTMASSLIADELGRELFRIDLAGIVSKYIGETEKNLSRVFAAAQRSNAVLFFDEADALFGKRTAVKDAHDRYANVETSYLLQKIESFDGIVVLATNFKNNVDDAFLRRMAVIVDFPMPALAERRGLWTSLMPESMPRGPEIDVDFLARRFEIAGGHIKNVIHAAAIRAAERADQCVQFGDLLHALRRELEKIGKIVDLSDFGEYRSHLESEA